MRYSFIRHLLIRSHWKRWLLPVICLIPYFGSLVWLVSSQLFWVAQIMLAPLVLGLLLALLTILLALVEFRGALRR